MTASRLWLVVIPLEDAVLADRQTGMDGGEYVQR